METSNAPAISEDGAVVGQEDTNGWYDVFAYDRIAATTGLASRNICLGHECGVPDPIPRPRQVVSAGPLTQAGTSSALLMRSMRNRRGAPRSWQNASR